MKLKGKRIFITGIGGFIGKRFAEIALEQGMTVTGIDISDSALVDIRRMGIDATLGDITDYQQMRQLITDVDIVFHTAAIVKEGGTMQSFRKINVEGSYNVAKAAKMNGCPTFVHLSSVMVYGFNFPAQITEEGPFRGENNPYCQTKIESERVVMALNEPGFGVIVIRPGDVYGPGSIPWVVRPIELMRKRLLPLVKGGNGIINHVFVDNLIDGILLAIKQQRYGEAFNISDGGETTWRDYFTQLAKVAKVPIPVSLPMMVLIPVTELMGKLYDLGIIETEIRRDGLNYVARPSSYSIDKARKVLGYEPRISLEDGMARIGQWLKR
ncbi:MAG: NAD(P)-dependent oxidoreductase [SAR324 cluster bacterium]|nr:NAD(P)-dependent oxidoreductase [SAR324 cluster bacterium]